MYVAMSIPLSIYSGKLLSLSKYNVKRAESDLSVLLERTACMSNKLPVILPTGPSNNTLFALKLVLLCKLETPANIKSPETRVGVANSVAVDSKLFCVIVAVAVSLLPFSNPTLKPKVNGLPEPMLAFNDAVTTEAALASDALPRKTPSTLEENGASLNALKPSM